MIEDEIAEALELEPCPFCKHDTASPWQRYEDHGDDDPMMSWVIWCDYCGADGPVADTPTEAAEFWNRRPSPD